jgi:hypothetical protein
MHGQNTTCVSVFAFFTFLAIYSYHSLAQTGGELTVPGVDDKAEDS